jgi:hypothetical protein
VLIFTPTESRDYEDQRESAADDPDSNLDRKRVCDANGMAKNIDQSFHLSVSARQVNRFGPAQYKDLPTAQV